MIDTAEPTAPRDPAAYAPRGRKRGRIWALAAFGVVCVAAGYGAGRLGEGLLPAPPPARSPVGGFEAAPPVSAAPPVPLAAPLPPVPAEPPEGAAGLSERVQALEARQAEVAGAAAAALAASALLEAAQTSRPFAAELASVEALAPGDPEIAALKPHAERGVPSRAALAASFPGYAARAAAARAGDEPAGLLARLGRALGRIVSLRRVGEVAGDGPDALLARAELSLADGDLAEALANLDRLPPERRAALAPWRERAEARLAVDAGAARMRARALADLGRIARGGS
ncbi:MAG: COG4223 family protein [Phenylobacterium sp.]|jgi:hypothetical protein|uniref:COG4223 family protein n=1 Tax=Phenylobacterium sp. TaxID=1871053 RepID=UPI00391AD44B